MLLVDLDSQASLTISAGLEPYNYGACIVSIMKNKARVPTKDCIQALHDNLHIITSRIELARQEMEVISETSREKILERALSSIKGVIIY